MLVNVTLDRYDGSESKSLQVDLADFPVRDLIFKMMESDIYGFTVTKVNTLIKACKKLEQGNSS